MFNLLKIKNLQCLVRLFVGLLVTANVSAGNPVFPIPLDLSKIGTTTWVDQTLEPVNVFLATTATFPLELSIDPMTQDEVKWVHQQIYDWAVLDNQKLKQWLRDSAQSNYEKGLYDAKQLKNALASSEQAHWGCLAWLFIKDKGVNKPVGFQLQVQNTSTSAGSLKVNGKLRESFNVNKSGSTTHGAFSLRDFTPLTSIQEHIDLKKAPKPFGFQDPKYTGEQYQLEAYTPPTTDASFRRSEKDRVGRDLRVDKRSGQCTLLNTTCRTYSFDIDTLQWAPYAPTSMSGMARANNIRLKRQLPKPIEFVYEDPCVLNLGSTFEQSSAGISRGFGRAISGLYVRLKDGSRTLKKDSKVLEDEIKPFVDFRKN